MHPARSIRLPAVAGSFYPGDPERLAQQVDDLLQHAGARNEEDNARDHVRMLVAPHAGYRYSGAVAARAFARLERASFDTAVLIGPSHIDAFAFSSIFEGDAYQTPLGLLEVDAPLARRLAGAHDSLRLSGRGHVTTDGKRGEHGLEVLLPFLQRSCGSPRIVPIVMGIQDFEACVALGRAIVEHADAARTLVVASSDLSHFHRYEEAVRRDAAFCEALMTLDPARVHDAVRTGRCEACGTGPVVASLIATTSWPGRQGRILACINSGDVTGERESVVGYAAAVIGTP